MRWTEYPDRAARNAGGPAREVTGQHLAPAPGGGQWAVEEGGRTHRVRSSRDSMGRPVLWCAADECPS